MDWIGLMGLLLGGGGVVYLIVDRLVIGKKGKADAKGKEVENAHAVADLYKEIDVIVEAKTQPILDNQQRLLDELNDIRAHWCCYRSGCLDRILYKTEDDTDSCIGGDDV